MFSRFGIEELLILLLIILILFGPGRISRIAGELGEGIRNFRAGLSGGGKEEEKPQEPVAKTEKTEQKE
ncbi:MAG: twin-arginine translocase TatA/TatE family subunit [Anaerolineales bacterium]